MVLIDYYPFSNGTIDESFHGSDAIVNGIGYTRGLHDMNFTHSKPFQLRAGTCGL